MNIDAGASSADPSSLEYLSRVVAHWADEIRSASAVLIQGAKLPELGLAARSLAFAHDEVRHTIDETLRSFNEADRRVGAVVRIALGEAGYREGPNESSKYGLWFGMNHAYWCAMFVSWSFARAGFPLPPVNGRRGFASVQSGWQYAQRTRRLVWRPKPGDIFLISHGKGRGHTGIVTAVDRRRATFTTIEGNTNAAGQRNGSMVRSKTRPIASANKGFWRVQGDISASDRVAPLRPRGVTPRRSRGPVPRRTRRPDRTLRRSRAVLSTRRRIRHDR